MTNVINNIKQWKKKNDLNSMWNSYLFTEQKVEVKISTYANGMILFSAKLVHKYIAT